MADNSEKIRVVGITHRDKDEEGRTRFFFEAEGAGGAQFKGFVTGNEHLAKWCGPGKTFYGDIRDDQGLKDSKGQLWARVWRDWDKNAKGEPRQTDRPAGGGGGGGPSTTPLSLEAAIAVYDGFTKVCAGDKAKAALMFQKLAIHIPYDTPGEQSGSDAPAGFTAASDDEIPF